MQNITLNNNISFPILGLGTFKISSEKEVEKTIFSALDIGYRSIDTAAIYRNEKQIGNSIKKYGIARSELFITTKVWNSEQGYSSTLQAFSQSLQSLQVEYIDLYLIHWAVTDKYMETWRAMEKLYKDGKIRAIGVSNFQIHHLKDILSNCKIKPTINQIELNPFFTQTKIRNFCAENNIQIQAWSPLVKGRIPNKPILQELSKKYNKTPAQIILRWHIENNIIAIPKSSNPLRLKENFNIFDFKLTKNEILLLNNLNQNKRVGPDPDNFNF